MGEFLFIVWLALGSNVYYTQQGPMSLEECTIQTNRALFDLASEGDLARFDTAEIGCIKIKSE